MSERGVFAVDRGIFTDEAFAPEPFTEREAFLWLVAEASWKSRRVRTGSAVVELSRGQLCHSVRFMAEAWQWSKSRVDRFLSKLEKRDSISRTSGTATSVVTICKYDEFQRVSLPERDSDGTPAGTPVGQQRDKLEDIKTLIPSLSEAAPSDDRAAEQGEKHKDLLGEPVASDKPETKKRKRNEYPEAFDRLWDAFPTDKNMSKQEAFKAWQKLDADDRAALLASVGPFKAWVATQRDYRVVHLERYIKWRRFDGFAPSTADKAKPAGSDLVAGISPDRWRNEIRNWQNRGGHWPLGRLTPPPDHPNTKVPRAILAEFGLPARSVLAA